MIHIRWVDHPGYAELWADAPDGSSIRLTVLSPELTADQDPAETRAQIEGLAEESDTSAEFFEALLIGGYLTHERYHELMYLYDLAYRAATIVYDTLPSRVITMRTDDAEAWVSSMHTQGEWSDQLMALLEGNGISALRAAVIAEAMTSYLLMSGGRFGNLDEWTESAEMALNAAMGGQNLGDGLMMRPDEAEVTRESIYAMTTHVFRIVPDERDAGWSAEAP